MNCKQTTKSSLAAQKIAVKIPLKNSTHYSMPFENALIIDSDRPVITRFICVIPLNSLISPVKVP